MNAFQFTDGFVDVIGQITGDFDPSQNLICETNACDDLVEPNLANEINSLPAEDQYSFIFRGNAQVLDLALTSEGLEPLVRGTEFGRGNADAAVDLINDDGSSDPATLPLRASDHDGLVLYIVKDGDDDGVTDDVDLCPATEIPERVPTDELEEGRYALVDDDTVFDIGVDDDSDSDSDSSPPAPPPVFTTEDTGGCSCDQIIDALDLDDDLEEEGCTLRAMQVWVEFVETGVFPDSDSDSSDSDSSDSDSSDSDSDD